MQDTAKKIIRESGHSFQCKVVNYFREKNWTVLISPYYVDASTDKTREIDLIVEKDYRVPKDHPLTAGKWIRVRLFVECKFVANEVVFWFDSKNHRSALDWIEANTPFRGTNTFIKQQHYSSTTNVAKLFASEKQKGDENEPIFRTLNQCLNGFVHNRGRDFLLSLDPEAQVTKLEYPVIVCSDFRKFHRTEINGDEEPTSVASNFLLEVNYAYLVNASKAQKREYFLIDVVTFELLDNFLGALEDEVAGAKILVGDN